MPLDLAVCLTPCASSSEPAAAPAIYEIDTALERMDLRQVHAWLSTDTVWSRGRSREVVERAAAGSVNFGAFAPDGSQVGYARLVTDGATFAWLCDVYVDRAHRGHGVGTRLAQAVVRYAQELGLSRVMLSTRDAGEIYARVGFQPEPHPDRLMVFDRGETAADQVD